LRGGIGVEVARDKRSGEEVETALLILAFIVACMAAIALQMIITVCWMSLDLQEQGAVHDVPIVMRVKFGKCHHK